MMEPYLTYYELSLRSLKLCRGKPSYANIPFHSIKSGRNTNPNYSSIIKVGLKCTPKQLKFGEQLQGRYVFSDFQESCKAEHDLQFICHFTLLI